PATAAVTITDAIVTAVSDRPGPVVLEIPDDIFAGPVPDQPFQELSTHLPIARPSAPNDELVRAAGLLRTSRRPILLVGSGAIWSSAWGEVQPLAESLNAPVLTSIPGKAIIPAGPPLSAGVPGLFGQPGATALLAAADTSSPSAANWAN